MAPDRRVGSPGRGDEADRLPRNYEAGHFGGYREPADGRHESGQRPAGAPRAGSSGRFRAVARAMEEGAAVAVGGPRAERCRAAARRARTRDHRLPVDPLFPRRGAVPCRRGQGSDALQGRAADALRIARGGRGVPPQLRRRDLHGGQGRGEARAALSRAALHDLHVAAGGGAQAGDVGFADHVRRAAPLRAGSHHLHAYRLGEPLDAGAGAVQGADHESLRREVFVVP